jgi:hypothetical protein
MPPGMPSANPRLPLQMQINLYSNYIFHDFIFCAIIIGAIDLHLRMKRGTNRKGGKMNENQIKTEKM